MATESKMGRPRSFNEDQAVEAALLVFWEKSYDGATMTDLTDATGLSRSSLHAAFGNKLGLFQRAMERYREGPMSYQSKAMEKASLKEALEALLHGMTTFLAIPGNPRGCFSIHGALVCGRDGQEAQQIMATWRAAMEEKLKQRVERAKKQGELRKGIDAADFTRLLAAFMAGMGMQALNGATKAELRRLADLTLELLEGALATYGESVIRCAQPPTRARAGLR